ncbi:MAG: Protein-export protein SecB [Alphaproteobacteria bacterium MarineAlpha11_Bin1]|nr:MAG: Protein-export protein SecB [Alphaproteobacteria bacterium MarineAlpha11_Bin1]|tara:strand:+ start:17178 stop:17681 length:504 start_codon:yes stop_codon:yes gene_type:complete
MSDDPDMQTDNATNISGADTSEDAGPFLIIAQYIKDLSFENPRGMEALSAIQQNPDVSVDVRTNAQPLGEDGLFEVSVFIRAEATLEDVPVFIVELTYSGIVQVSGVQEEEVKPIVLIEGPRHLFPFARAIVSNAVRDGGFPPLMINPIDFSALFIEQHVDSDGSDI